MKNIRSLGRIRGIIGLAVLFLIGGCAGVSRLTPLDPAFFETEVLPDLTVRARLMETLRTQMTIQIEEKGQTSEANTVLYFKRPDSFALHVLDPLNAPLVVIRAHEGVFSMLDVRASKGIRGPLTDALLRQQFRMDVRVSDVKQAIFANPFVEGETKHLEIGRRGETIVVKRPSVRIGHLEEIHLERVEGEYVVTEWWIRSRKGKTVLHARFWNYRDVGGILRPIDAEIDRPADRTRLRFHAIRPEVNLELSDATFAHRFPPNAQIRVLGERNQADATGE